MYSPTSVQHREERSRRYDLGGRQMKIELNYEVNVPNTIYTTRKKTLKVIVNGEPDDVLAIRNIINLSLEDGKWKEL